MHYYQDNQGNYYFDQDRSYAIIPQGWKRLSALSSYWEDDNGKVFYSIYKVSTWFEVESERKYCGGNEKTEVRKISNKYHPISEKEYLAKRGPWPFRDVRGLFLRGSKFQGYMPPYDGREIVPKYRQSLGNSIDY
jgi:hypothetical protein